MDKLRREDMRAIASQAKGEWEFRHPGMECPHNMSMRNLKDIEDEGIFELQLAAHLPKEA